MSAPGIREGQTFTGASRLIAYVNLVKLPHTVFALPFALVGVVLASYRRPLRVADLGWVILAFTAARFAAMAFNRIVDREIDRRNPRTAQRELPQGVLTVWEASLSVLIASGLFIYSAAQLNRLCLLLSPVALAWIFFYSFTKRFTRWSHLVLGWSLAKVIVVVDHWVDVRNKEEAWWVALNNLDPQRDVRFSMGPIDVLDHSSRGFTFGSKMGLDGTRKLPEEGFTRDWPKLIEMDEATKRRVDEMWSRLELR